MSLRAGFGIRDAGGLGRDPVSAGSSRVRAVVRSPVQSFDRQSWGIIAAALMEYPAVAAFGIPIAFLLCGALGKKLMRGTGWERKASVPRSAVTA
jgi:hypothetical protein